MSSPLLRWPASSMAPRRLGSPAALALALLPAVATAEPVCLTVDGPPEVVAEVRQSLEERGIGPSAPGCSPARLQLQESSLDGHLDWLLEAPGGDPLHRSLSSVAAGAAWVDSLLRRDRLTGVLTVPAPVSAPDSPHSSAPPDSEPVRLYASFTSWKAGRPSGQLDARLIEKLVSPEQVAAGGLEPMVALDRGRRAARAQGAVFAIEHGGEVYVNDRSPRASRNRTYGRLEVVGDRGLFQYEHCMWVTTDPSTGAGYVRCEVQMHMLDLTTGAVTPLGRSAMKELLADHPELLEQYRSTRPKTARLARQTARAALQASSHP